MVLVLNIHLRCRDQFSLSFYTCFYERKKKES